jgi:hypothetical protein
MSPQISPAQARCLLDLIKNKARTGVDPDGTEFGQQISEDLESCELTLKSIANGPDLPCDRPTHPLTCSRPRHHTGPCSVLFPGGAQ